MSLDKDHRSNPSRSREMDTILKRIKNLNLDEYAIQEIITSISDYYQGIILNMPANVYWTDDNGTGAGCNKNVLDMFELKSVEDFKGLTFEEMGRLAHWDNATTESFKQDTLSVLKTGIPKINIEEPPIPGPDGQPAYFLTSRVPIFNKDNHVVSVMGISIDITERKKSEQELLKAKIKAEAANVAKTEFVQNMQHDIRTPAAGVWSLLNEMMNMESEPKRKELLQILCKSSQQLLELCDAVVDFDHIEKGEEPITEKRMDLRALVTGVIELNKPAAFMRGLELELKIDAKLPQHIMSDEFRLRRILVNLVGNAIKFTDQGKISLHIRNQRAEDERYSLLCIDVIDTGIGIDPTKYETIFEKFSRGLPANTQKYPGTGLGLYLVKKFVTDLDGDLDFKSTLGQGSQFSITLPFKTPLLDLGIQGIAIDEIYSSPIEELQDCPASNEDLFTFNPASHKKRSADFKHRVLFVEDEKLAMYTSMPILSRLTYSIDSAETLAQAKQKLDAREYDLVICDLGLPDGSGEELLQAVKNSTDSKNRNTPFIALTAHQDRIKHQKALDAGFSEVDSKPLTEEKARHFFENHPIAAERLEPEDLPAIDLDLGMQRLGEQNPSKAIKALEILTFALGEDIPPLKKAEREKDIKAVRFILHKLRGGLYYTGTPRLENAVQILHDAVQLEQNLAKLAEQFQAVYDEVLFFEKSYQELLRSQGND